MSVEGERVPLIDAISEHVRKEYPMVRDAVQKNPRDPKARQNLRNNAETAARVLEELINKTPDEKKRRSAEIDEMHGIVRNWEEWRRQNP